ncbi:6-carboxytetrahydropterin synthase [Streptomyces sp. NPDC004539]|uniref:6-carboxytetrahydropterin synthase n=1 Tax=Streptomyces sp. NPDC004539 TaxID=3154280 RepID=UPI0033AAA93F
MNGSWRIGKTFRFEATREVAGRLDGRTFTAEVVLASRELTDPGFVVDFGELAPVKEHIDAWLDHRLLNEVVADAGDDGLARYLETWAREHLTAEAASALLHVRVSSGRPVPVPAHLAVTFDASHRLDGLPSWHRCARLHGHSYQVVLPVQGTAWPAPVEVPSFLADYITDMFDGRLLNEVVGNPTCEHLAEHLAHQVYEQGFTGPDGLPVGVRVSETESTWGEYLWRPE